MDVNGKTIPFDASRLDRLMAARDLDTLIVTTKHNIRYLLGGYAYHFFASMDAIGVSRYLPAFVYSKGRPDRSFYVGCVMERFEHELGRFWVPNLQLDSWTTGQSVAAVAQWLEKLGGCRRIGIEAGFLPYDAGQGLAAAVPNATWHDCSNILERLRAVKTPAELDLLREGSERVIASMTVVFEGFGTGASKYDLIDAMCREEVSRGMVFDYCLAAIGSSLNRSPSDQRIAPGDVVSLDSGGSYHGYIGDLCRMGVAGDPDGELQDLLDEIEQTQMAARVPIKAGALGQEIYDHGLACRDRQANAERTHFLAHGIGLVSHEAPRLTSSGPIPYEADDAERPLETGMVISIETTLPHPRRGLIKLEDTIAVTETGFEAYGDGARGWNRMPL